MVMVIISKLSTAWFGLLLPSFSTFKALSHRPISEPELERWSKYWTVLGIFVAFEYTAEWFISWLPFYWELKTIFILFLALPQTQGSNYIYDTYVQPFLSKNEADLDSGILSAQAHTLTFVQEKAGRLWELLVNTLNKKAAEQRAAGQPTTPGAPGAPGTPATQPPASNAGGGLNLESAMGLWRTYGPAVTGYLQSQTRAAPAPASSPVPVPPAASPNASTTSFQSSMSTPAERRTPQGYDATGSNPSVAPPFPVPQHS